MASRLSAFAALNNSDSEEEPQDFENAPFSKQNSTSDLVIDLGIEPGSTYDYSSRHTPDELNFCSTVILTEGDNIIHYQGYQLIGLTLNETLMFKGQYTISVIFGSITIDMYKLDTSKELNVNATDINSLPYIKTFHREKNTISPFSKQFHAVIKIANVNPNLDISEITTLYPHVRNLYTIENHTNKSTMNFCNFNYSFANLVVPEPNKISTTVSSSWMTSFEQLVSDFKFSDRSKSVLIIGNKNTGKSTYLRLLSNYLLSENINQSIQILDIDPGQPELCQPSCINLTQIQHPFVGTHDPHLRETKHLTKFIGFTSPNIQPLNYLYQLGKFIETIEKDKNKITLINSPGWVKGFGAEIIAFIANSLDLAFLIQLSSDHRDLDILKEIEWATQTEIIKLESISKLSNVSMYSPAIIRTYKLLSYMHYDQIQNNFDFSPLIFKSPYMLPYICTTNNIDKLSHFEGIIGISIFESDGTVLSSLANCLECQFAALVTVKANQIDQLIDSKKMVHTTKLPNLIDDAKFQKVESKFYGLCVIHSVDVKNQVLNIYTPIKFDKLIESMTKHNEKLLLVKGKENVPIEEMYSNQIIKKDAQYWSSFGLQYLPYLSPSLTNEAVGGKTVGIRRNIQRR